MLQYFADLEEKMYIASGKSRAQYKLMKFQ